ncbi:MAG TPA: arginase [Gallionellaceae bacterium]|nr:arginase [Gallionellaceae bacterium]
MSPRPSQAVRVIGVASGLGARDPGCADGPAALRELGVFDSAAAPVSWGDILGPALTDAPRVKTVAELCGRLARRVEQELNAGSFPLVVGGDHSCAVGTWSGVRHGLQGPLGLVWVDAHMDSHTFATSPTGALHGMPLACLLGHGAPELTELVFPGPKLRPEHVCLLGVRSYEAGEAALLKALGVRVIGMEEVHARGLQATFAEAVAIARNGTAGYGISIDLDALDPVEEPGVGSPAPDGLLRLDLEFALRVVHGDRALLAMEIAEYNPHRDRRQLTAAAAGRLLDAVLEE